ncbi:hypothetical protein N7512_006311 [Penicillium capsulatum]|nr:hypothetical protein N7512_006311 [Penicillium capsulatum]
MTRINLSSGKKRRCFRGRAKIFLDHLDYHGISSRGKVDEKHVEQLINVFRSEGCMRLHDPEHYVPGLISSEELTRAVSYSKIRRLHLMQDGEPPILNLPDNLKIRVLHGEHRMRAAERFLEPREKWWVVMLYTPQLGETTKDAIQEEYSHQLKFTDGEIYRNIRLHASRQDTRRVKKWEARLSSSKRDVLSSLDKRPNRPIRDGFNKSLPFSGLWDALKIGSLKRILSLRCPEDQHLFGLIDPQTINQLETLTPEASHDALLITKMMDKGEILPAIEDSIIREEIKTRILQHRGRILSFNTFFDDWKYMEALVKSLRPLLPSGFQGSLRDEFSSIFKSDRLCPGQIKIQTGERRYRIERSTSDQQKWLSYLMIFLAAMRDFPVLSQTTPRKSRGKRSLLSEAHRMNAYHILPSLPLRSVSSQRRSTTLLLRILTSQLPDHFCVGPDH